MDAMALLCNLHADGPATLRSLREGGCSTLDELLDQPAERLAELLGIAPASARRFLREGRNLRERLGGELLEREEELRAPAAAAPAATGDPGRLPARERELLARVMQRWRSEDAPAAAPTPEPAAAQPAAPSGHPLDPGALEGLTAGLCATLRGAGIETLEALAEATLEEVDRETELGWSRLRRLQFLARRHLQRGPAVQRPALPPREPVEEKISLAFPARSAVAALEPEPEPAMADTGARAGDDGPAGPFA